jgi:LysR family transcriptional regulator, low CO2-responsive transcriptional regulator
LPDGEGSRFDAALAGMVKAALCGARGLGRFRQRSVDMPQSRIRRYLRHGTLPQLAVFEASARLASFTRAAEELHMAQPTVSAQIRKLTETVGLPLFEQIGKQIYLTAAGHRTHEHCRKLFAALAELDLALAGLRGLTSGLLRVASGTPGQWLMPRLVAAFAEDHPGLDIALRMHNRRDLIERLAANEDDLYVFANPPDDRELVRQAVASHALVVAARADHPLARRRGVPLADLADAAFIVRERGSGTRMLVEQAFASRGLVPRFRLEMTNDAAVRDGIRAGLGVGMLARTPDTAALDGVVELDVEGFPLPQTLYFVYPVGRELSPAAEAFLAHARAAADEARTGADPGVPASALQGT